MAWISSRSAVRQTVGVSWVQPVPGEHVQSRAGLGAGALSTWGLLFCCAESGFFTAWKLLVWEFLLLFLSPGILTGARGYLQPALSTHIGQSGKRKAALGVLCRFLPPAPGGSCSAAARDAQGCASTFGDCPRDTGSERGSVGMRAEPGEIRPQQSPWWGVEGGTAGTQGSAGCGQCSPAAGLCHSVTEGGSGTAQGLVGTCPPGAAPNSHSHTQGLWKSISSAEPCFPDRVCATAGLEPNEASNSQIIFDHFFNWRRIMEL